MYILTIKYITHRTQNFYNTYFYYLSIYIHVYVYIFNIPNPHHIICCQGQIEVYPYQFFSAFLLLFGLYMKSAVYRIYEIMRKA